MRAVGPGFRLAVVGVLLLAGCGGEAAEDTAGSAAERGLIGTWVARLPAGELQLVIESDSRLVFAGDPATYRRVGDALEVQADGELQRYGIRQEGDSLTVTFPDGTPVAFQRRVQAAPAGAGGQPGGRDDPRFLAGTLMNFGSAQAIRSSYARTTRVTFDGRGGFVVRNETNFSSDAGGHYANPVTDRGTYRIQGDRVLLQFAGGGQGVAAIKVRQPDGRITELIYDGDLYGPEP